jgi:hypothetical protein
MSLEVTIPILQAGQTAAELASLNPIGFERQLVFETDTLKAKLLDGVTAYNSLPYLFINSSVVWGGIGGTLSNQTDLQNALNAKQATLVNQINIKSINGNSLLGSGDLSITTDLSAYLTIASAASTYATIASLSSYLTTAAAASTYVPYTGATQDVNLGEFELKAGQIEYDQTPTGAAGVAITRWNDSIGTLETTLKGGNVVLKHGRDLFERVVNKTGIQLTKAAYQAVRVSTAQGQRLGVALAQANNDNNSADTIGLVVETIDNNQEGMIYVVGEIDGINTTGSLQSETWADGDVLYLSPTTAGRITNVKPVAPQHLVVIGYVVYAHANQGKIYVKVMNGFELGELHDVDTTGATNGQVLKYNGTIWTAQTDLNSGVWGSITGTLSSQTDLQSALDGKVDENAAITGATKTKITYDAKGLVTSGADATTADIAASTNKNYVTDAQLTVIGNTSGTNSGNQTLANTSDATSHTVTLSATGGSVQLVEGSGITLTTTGTAADGIITIASSGGGSSFADNVFEIYDNTDNTKKLAFEASGITTGTTRTLTIPNASGTIALTSDLASYVPYTGATTSVNLGANNLTATVGTFTGNLVVDTNTLFVDAANNRVGIGTATPSFPLDIISTATNQLVVQSTGTAIDSRASMLFSNNRASFASVAAFLYGNTTNTSSKLGQTMADKFFVIADGANNLGMAIGTNGNVPLFLATNNSTRLTVTGGGLLAFGTGITSAFPALKRNSTELQVRLADDSAFAPLISGRFEANQPNITINNIATAITNGSFIGANLGGQQFGLLIGVDQSGFSYIQGRYLSAADHIRIQEFGSGISVGSATGDGYIAIGRTSQLASSRLGISVAPTASANYGLVSLGSGAFDGATSGFFTGVAAGTAIAVNLASGGTSDLLNMQVAGVGRFKISSAGKPTYDSTITAGGTTGNQTINKPSGTVNIAAAGTTVTVTNSLVSTSSIVIAVVRTNDSTAYIKNVVPSAGSFVITLGAAATAEVSIGFIVNN